MNVISSRRLLIWIVITAIVVVVVTLTMSNSRVIKSQKDDSSNRSVFWQPPDTSQIPLTAEGMLIRYGRDLIVNTSYYLGPRGKIAKVTNGMNCQNCHLDAGTRSLGNNYSAVFSTYPKFRDRSGAIEDIYKRVNDCVSRSLNGTAIDTNSHEMQAIYAYIKWLGQKVPKGVTPSGAGIESIATLDRAADPSKGQIIYAEKCQRCHGDHGQGKLNADNLAYQYPPLWGDSSYNTGAGLYRISRFAGYVMENMPFDAATSGVRLTNEESWDVAAFVNSQPRPEKNYKMDWPNIAGKPFDHPFGPYADNFSEEQHKFGPFDPIRAMIEKSKKKTN